MSYISVFLWSLPFLNDPLHTTLVDLVVVPLNTYLLTYIDTFSKISTFDVKYKKKDMCYLQKFDFLLMAEKVHMHGRYLVS